MIIMPKEFHVTGTCIPDKHYMVNTSEKIQKIITDYIQVGSYFTINRARQYGKTTTLYLLETALKNDYIVLSLSFESADELFVSLYTFAAGLVRKIYRLLKRKNMAPSVLENWNSPISKDFPFDDLSDRISELCESCDKNIVLMIDEVDKSSDNQIFLSFLGLLREKFLEQQKGNDVTFYSVILAGVYDIKNLKLKLHPNTESKNNSPWNIAVDFLVDMSFSQKDIACMLKDYESDYHTNMDIYAISQLIYDYTSGYPYLVSRICQLIDTRVAGTVPYPEKYDAWTKDGFLEAIRILLKETNSLFDDMVKHLYEYPKLNAMLQNILFRGTRYTFEANSQIINLGMMFGFLKEQQNTVVVANRIFETKMYNFFLSEEESNGSISFTGDTEHVKNQFVAHR